MKKIVIYVLIGILVGAGLMYLLRPTRFPNEVKPATPTSFRAVTGQLDAGGDLYAYVSTERLIRTVNEMIAKFTKAMPGQTGGSEMAAVSFAFRLIGKLGLNEISGVGLSNVALTPDLQRTRMVVHHYQDQSQGLIWQLAGNEPRELTELNLLPSDTAIAAFNELRLDTCWSWIKKELNASGIPDVQKYAGMVEPMLAIQGVQLPKLLASLTGSMGYMITLDRQRKVTLPGGEHSWSIPEPGLALVIGVKDSTLFDLLKAKLSMAKFSEKAGRKTLQFSALPMPVPLQPCIVSDSGLLIVASTTRLAEAILQSRDKADGLVKSEEYKELARYVPDRGNGFSFVSPRFWSIMTDIIKKRAGADAESKPFTDIFFSLFPREMKAFAVVQHHQDGSLWTVCHNLSPELIILLPVASAVGMASAVAIPNLLQAGDKGKQKKTMEAMKEIGTAIESYKTDYGKSPAGESLSDLQSILAPIYIKSLPLRDAWGNDLLYKKTGKGTYMIASPGKDGTFLGWEQKGSDPQPPAPDYDQDIIFANGQFVFGPEA
jgi:hypothetical protein